MDKQGSTHLVVDGDAEEEEGEHCQAHEDTLNGINCFESLIGLGDSFCLTKSLHLNSQSIIQLSVWDICARKAITPLTRLIALRATGPRG